MGSMFLLASKLSGSPVHPMRQSRCPDSQLEQLSIVKANMFGKYQEMECSCSIADRPVACSKLLSLLFPAQPGTNQRIYDIDPFGAEPPLGESNIIRAVGLYEYYNYTIALHVQ